MSSSGFGVIRRHSSDATGIRIKELTQELAKQRSQIAGSQLETDDVRSQGRMDHSTIKLNDERLKFIDILPNTFDFNYEFPTEPDFNFLKVWFMLDHLGTRMRDMSGFGNDAIIQGHPTLRRANLIMGFGSTDLAGGTPVMLFNSGTDVVSQRDGEYIWIPDNPSIQFTLFPAGFSIAFRFNCLNFNSHFNPLINFTASRRFASKTDNATNGWNLLVYSSNTEGTQGGVEFEITHNGVQYQRKTSGYAADTWYQVVVTYDPNAGSTSAARIKIYTAGVENSSDSVTGAILPTQTNLRIGARSADTGFFHGYIHDFRLYMGKVLTSTEVTNWNQNEVTIDNIPKRRVFILQHALFGWSQSNHTHRYGIGGYTIKEKIHKFHVTNKVTRTRTHKFSIIARVLRTRTHKFNVIRRALKTVIHKFVVTGKITRPKIHKYNITAKMPIPAVKTHKFNILNTVPTITKTHKFNIVKGITVTKTHKYNMGGKVSPAAVKTHKYNIIGKITTSKTHKYALGGLQSQYIRFQKSSTAGSNIIQEVTFNETPQALIVWTDGTTVDNTYVDGHAVYYGFSDGTNHACISAISRDNVTTSDTFAGHKNDRVISLMQDGVAVGSMVAEATVSFSDSKAIFNWTTNNSSQVYIHCIALWGVNRVEVKTFQTGTTSTGSQIYSLNNSNITPTLLQTINTSSLLGWDISNGAAFSIGTGLVNNSTIKQFSIVNVSQDNLGTSSAQSGFYDDVSMISSHDDDNAATIEMLGTLTTLSQGSFTINWTTAPLTSTHAFSVLAIDTPNVDLVKVIEPAATGNQVIAHNANVTKSIMMFSNHLNTSNLQALSAISIGGASGTLTAEQGCITTRDNHAAAVTIGTKFNKTGSVVKIHQPSATAASSLTRTQASLTSIGTNTMTLNWDARNSNRTNFIVVFGGSQ